MAKNVGVATITVTATGAAVQVTTAQTFVSMFTLVAPSGNSGVSFIGGSDASGTKCVWQLVAGDSVSIELPKNAAGNQIKIDLSSLYVLGTTSDTISVGHFNC